jgi:hypothetical protein
MVLDLVVMLMPLHELYHLQLSLRKKALMMTIFSLGILYVFGLTIGHLPYLSNEEQCHIGQHTSPRVTHSFCKHR